MQPFTSFVVFSTHTAPSGPPDNITAVALSSTSMIVSWSPPIQQFRNGPILAYNFTVTESSTGLVVQSSILLTTTATIFSLVPFTTYNFTLSARTSVGYGPSDTISAITLEDSKQYSSNTKIITPYKIISTCDFCVRLIDLFLCCSSFCSD